MEALPGWVDSYSMVPSLFDSFTSLKSDSHHTIDYVLTCAMPINIETYGSRTLKDHKLI